MTSHETLAAALAAAQAAMPAIVKDRVAKIGPGREYRYADLATILATVRPVLGAHGLALTQRTQIRGEAIVLLGRDFALEGELAARIEALHGVTDVVLKTSEARLALVS